MSGVPILEDKLSLFFVQATIILGITRSLSIMGTYLKQPKVIFEIIGGILLGPSAIGRNQAFLDQIFPQDSLNYLDIVANIGLTLYLFLVGMELDPNLLKTHARRAGFISFFGLAVPFCLGIAISRTMFDTLQGDDPDFQDVDFTSFFVFIGVAMSITAFPVLARLLKEGGLIYTNPGAMAMGAAAIDDTMAWCLLTLAIALANAGELATSGYIFATIVGFALVLFLIVKPLFAELVAYIEAMHRPDMNQNLFVLTLCLVFMSAWTTALLGVHAIFGSFLFGLVVPRGSHLFKECNERIEELVVSFTLPLYFALSGLKTDFTTISSNKEGAMVVLVCFCATAGKFVGAGGAALLGGMSIRESAVVATLMNTRGLVELIVLNLGISSGILNTRTFTVMVLMCLFTTFMTSPVVEYIYPMEMRKRALLSMHKDSQHEETSSEGTASFQPESMSADNYSRVSLVIDQVLHLQPLVDTLGFMAPNKRNGKLAVTALHFIEPTNSTSDEFLALNERGKLIRIDEESTAISQALAHLDDPSKKPPELLPVSVFCKAMHMPVNAFRIQGDPDEFPSELRHLSKQNGTSIVLMPWKAGHYMQKFIWQTINHADVPTVLIVANHEEEEVQVKARSNTLLGYGVEQEYAEVLYTNVPMDALPVLRRESVTATIARLPDAEAACNVIVAVLLGEPADVVILSLCMRMAYNKANEVRVYLPKDHEAFPIADLDALALFKKTAADEGLTVAVHELQSISIDYQGIVQELPSYDMLLTSYVEPREGMESRPRSPSRTRSFSGAAQPIVINDTTEARVLTGMPDALVTCALINPELGMLATLLHESKHSKSSIVLVVHAPEKNKSHKHHRAPVVVSEGRELHPEGVHAMVVEMTEIDDKV